MSIDACAQMVARADPDRFASAMCVKSLAQRADLMCLYAFNIEVARAPWVTQEEMIAEMRLQWWKDAIAEIYEGKTVRKHEVVTPLADLVTRMDGQLPRALFDDLIEARRFDIYREGHGSPEAFNRYISNTSGGLMEAAGRVLGTPDGTPFRSFGEAMGLANLITALPEIYAHGRDPMPLGDLDRNAVIEGRLSDENMNNIKELIGGGLAKLASVQPRKIPKSARPALWAGWRAKRILTRAQKAPEQVLRTDFSCSPLRRSATLFWLSSGFG